MYDLPTIKANLARAEEEQRQRIREGARRLAAGEPRPTRPISDQTKAKLSAATARYYRRRAVADPSSASKLRILRHRRGLTMADVSAGSLVSFPVLWRAEQRERQDHISAMTWRRLSAFYGIPVEDLTG